MHEHKDKGPQVLLEEWDNWLDVFLLLQCPQDILAFFWSPQSTQNVKWDTKKKTPTHASDIKELRFLTWVHEH